MAIGHQAKAPWISWSGTYTELGASITRRHSGREAALRKPTRSASCSISEAWALRQRPVALSCAVDDSFQADRDPRSAA